ncbi:OsmC family peroxiredoxin [Solicola sp. PLA-1-18]|uniref:OsmC family peroxiredoxin n=1 Tax=Solicola sp. PLA-1-18 TaxID=3380532 RepID=UPI003B82BAD8
MSPVAMREARARWTGSLPDGEGAVTLATSGAAELGFSLDRRASDTPDGTGPEELLGAAHAACYAMQLSAILTFGGTPPESIDVSAQVTQGGPDVDFGITGITLTVRAVVPGLEAAGIGEAARQAKEQCPVGRALGGVPVELEVL